VRSTTSVVCGVMDRQEHLLQVLPTWLACPGVDEVVLVDWSSRRPLEVDDPRVVVARARGQASWCASRCHNLGLSLATGDLIMRLDADDLLDPVFFLSHPPAVSSFYYADLSRIVRVDDVHLSGVVLAPRSLFIEVGGYNERLLTYGCDDDDLVRRLSLCGALALPVDLSLVRHVAHENALRVKNQDVGFFEDGSPASRSWVYAVDPLYRSVEYNKRELDRGSWSKKDEVTMWKIEGSRRYVRCVEIPS